MTTTLDAPPRAAAATLGKGRPWYWWAPYAGIGAIVLYCLSPFYWMLVSSLRRSNDIFSDAPVPSPFSVENYSAAFSEDNGFLRALLNSFLVAGITTVLVLLIGTLTAYALARLDFRFKNLVLGIVMVTSMFPTISLLVPLLELFSSIGWINTYQAMIVPSMSFALPLAVWNLTAFFRQMPTELEEAAQIDGCTPAQAFRKVILPLAAPGVFTTAIITFIAAWNEFIIALSVVNEKSLKTAPVISSQFTGTTDFDAPFGTQMAAGVIVTIPLVILVLLFQRRIVAGLTAGGVK
ncbi:Maltose/maltodextrin ABC transporter, permease protein MalG [Actinokineospora spheciospongiae]|uniref:Maltose/maltodextrin ABC transporter, permease protein MalG n=1 Tax=Actinokineospora spheciospongiae TaxID=909613 RepID=W7IDE1_9PSEU|nr:carbohydrate ABC transporter permease [Actinokineospora spheciospongiae]EWC58553.1 Maltose/maltodextrin ABC transporter, permease protein MalG [Actinokineospora spheciospongiae]PWW54878.1 carbohydrate ABC transporter membrane protein 2 (CUT1 family) [Actinokineospora spheciospongiae]